MSQGINGRLRILSPVLRALGLALALGRCWRRRWRWPNIVLALALALARALRGRSTVTSRRLSVPPPEGLMVPVRGLSRTPPLWL